MIYFVECIIDKKKKVNEVLLDFQNFSLEHCKELILEYQKTNNPKTFNILLARFDNYILFMIRNYKRYTSFLYSEDLQELYHTGIIGFHKGVLSFKEHLPVRFITLRLASYIVSELRQTYRYKIKENVNIFEMDELNREIWDKLYPCPISKYNTEVIRLSCELIMSSNILNNEEKELLTMRYFDNLTYHEIAEKLKVSYNVVYRSLEDTINKLQEGVRSE